MGRAKPYVVFPTRVGVNRALNRQQGRRWRIPHACGGEPTTSFSNPTTELVFPTRVGVNRVFFSGKENRPRVFPTRVGVNRQQPRRVKFHPAYSPRVWG